MRIHRSLLIFAGWLGLGASVAGCVGGPKQAADPRQIIGEDLDQGGVESSGATSPKPDPQAVPDAANKPPPEVLATRAECEKAARHVEELGVQLAINTETDPARKKKMIDEKAATLRSPEMQKRIESDTDQCLQRDTSQHEARCIAQIRSEKDIDGCEH